MLCVLTRQLEQQHVIVSLHQRVRDAEQTVAAQAAVLITAEAGALAAAALTKKLEGAVEAEGKGSQAALSEVRRVVQQLHADVQKLGQDVQRINKAALDKATTATTAATSAATARPTGVAATAAAMPPVPPPVPGK